MMQDLYLDIGSTNIKWEMGGERRFTPFPAPSRCDSPYFEVPAEEIVDLVRAIVCDAGAARVFLSVQMHGYVLLKEGRAITPYISWRDTRGTGIIPKFTLTPQYCVAIKPNLPRLRLQTHSEVFDEFCTLGSFLARCLTGENRTHITDAACTGFYCAGVAVEMPFRLPEVKEGEIGTFECARIFAPMGDQQCSVAGAVGTLGAFNGYILNLGTAAQMCCISPFGEGEFESRPYFGNQSLLTVTGLIGGGHVAKMSDETAEPLLVSAYREALGKLPRRERILVTGGLVRHRTALIERVLRRLDIPYTLNPDCDALAGLKLIARSYL